MFEVVVSEIVDITPHVKCFTLQMADASLLPPFTGGSHIIVQINANGQCYNNAYSLMSDPNERHYYQIAVRLAENSRGGSAWLHQHVVTGDNLTISNPHNQFALVNAEKYLLIAGGIGITPFISQLYELQRQQKKYNLHYCFHSPQNNAFQQHFNYSAFADYVHYHISTENSRLDLPLLLKDYQAGTHIYVCGPETLTEAVKTAARACNIADDHLHFEQFAIENKSGNAFTLVLSRSGIELQVPENMTILQVIENNKAASVECLCREGICGTCETRILEGEADHRDQYLSDEEREAQKTLLICCSRARTKRLVLDL